MNTWKFINSISVIIMMRSCCRRLPLRCTSLWTHTLPQELYWTVFTLWDCISRFEDTYSYLEFDWDVHSSTVHEKKGWQPGLTESCGRYCCVCRALSTLFPFQFPQRGYENRAAPLLWYCKKWSSLVASITSSSPKTCQKGVTMENPYSSTININTARNVPH